MKRFTLLSTMLLSAAPAFAQGAFLGVNLGGDEGGAEQPQGALITSVQEPSAASLMGLRDGDLITSVGDRAIHSARELQAAIGGSLPGSLVTISVLREGQGLNLMGILGRRPDDLLASAPQVSQVLPQPPASLNPELLVELERLQQEMNQLRAQMQGLPQGRWQHMELPLMDSLFEEHLEAPQADELPTLQFLFDRKQPAPEAQARVNGQTEVQLRYPGNTPQEDRERLRQEAIAKYGEGVQISFEGKGRSVMIQTRSTFRNEQGMPAPTPPTPPIAPLPPRERMRNF